MKFCKIVGGGVVFVLLAANSAVKLEAAPKWTLDSAEPTWWFTQSAWSEWPVSGAVTIGNGSKDGERSFVYLQDGDVVTGITDITLGNTAKKYRSDVFQVRSGAVLRFTGTMKYQAQRSTNVLDVAGGTIVGNAYHPGGTGEANCSLSRTVVTNGGVLALNASTLGWLGPAELLVDGGTLLVTNGNMTVSNGHRVDITIRNARFDSKALNLAGNANSSSAFVSMTDSVWTNRSELNIVGSRAGATCVWALTNSVFNSDGKAVKFGEGGVTSSTIDFIFAGERSRFVVEGNKAVVGGNTHMTVAGGDFTVAYSGGSSIPLLVSGLAGTVQTIDISGGVLLVTNCAGRAEHVGVEGYGKTLVRQTGGVFRAGAIKFNVDTSADNPRYEISGGTLLLEYWPGSIGTAGFVLQSGTKLPCISFKGANQTVMTPSMYGAMCYEFVLDRTGFNPVTIVDHGVSAQGWVNGYLGVKLDGGVQLLHTNAVTLVRSSMSHIRFNDTASANADLWETSPRAMGDGSFFDMTGCAGVVLKDSAELVPGAFYEAGRSSGFIRLPRVKAESTRSVTAKLKLVPQGDATLASLVDGFTAAGYSAMETEDEEYNVALDIPVSLVRDRSNDECLAFDFKSYATPDDLRDGNATVRALVQRAKIDKAGDGLLLIFR